MKIHLIEEKMEQQKPKSDGELKPISCEIEYHTENNRTVYVGFELEDIERYLGSLTDGREWLFVDSPNGSRVPVSIASLREAQAMYLEEKLTPPSRRNNSSE